MHGRLKIKTTAEQEAEKRKERDLKRKKYLAGINLVFLKREENIYDEETLSITCQLLGANPDALTLWNIRREILLNFKRNLDEKKWQELLEEELNASEYCLVKNPKSYGGWHHRDWVFRSIPSPSYSKELELCDRYLQKDDRNFHCWDHRRTIVKLSQRKVADELKFTEELIDKNFSNFSAWHYRSKLLPIVHPPPKDSPHPIAEGIFIKELQKVVTAVFTDPSDQSPWFFLRWLLVKKEGTQRLVQLGVIAVEKKPNLVLVFAKETLSIDNFTVFLHGKEVAKCGQTLFNQKFIWLIPLTLNKGTSEIRVKCSALNIDVALNAEVNESVSPTWVLLGNLFCETNLSDNAKKTLLEIKENCIQLDQLEPGNKWVLLTLVHIMAMLDVINYSANIFECLNQLEEIDPLRKRFYKDLRSKVLIEERMKKYLVGNVTHFELKDLQLTYLANFHYLCFIESLDLRGNCIRSLNPIVSCLNCSKLLLDGNTLNDLLPLSHLKNLREVSLVSCGIKSLSQLNCLIENSVLIKLDIAENEVAKESDFESKVMALLPCLQNLKF